MEPAEKIELIKLLKNQLDEYIQKKADFLAEVTTEPLATTKSAFFYREIIVPFITNTLLTDNLARNEGIGYRDILRNRFRVRVIINDKELKAGFSCTSDSSGDYGPAPVYTYPEELPYSLHCIHTSKGPGLSEDKLCKNPAHSSISDNSLLHIVSFENGDEDVEIELPGPLGEFAFYAFLENLVRNAAKHNKEVFDEKLNQLLEIVIRISDPGGDKEEFFKVEVFDNVSVPSLGLDETKGSGTLLETIHGIIKQAIIDNEFAQLKREAWGIAEMKICASLLTGTIDFKKLQDSLEANAIEFEGEQRLAYSFDFMKPKKLCAVVPGLGDKNGGIDDAMRKAMKRNGIWLFSDLEELDCYLSTSSSIASFRFFLLDCYETLPGETGILDGLIHKLPFRVVISSKAGNQLPKAVRELVERNAAVVTEEAPPYEERADRLMAWLWRSWVARWLKTNDGNITVEVFLDQEQSHSPSRGWIEHADVYNRTQQSNGSVKLRAWARDAEGQIVCATGEIGPVGRRVFFDRHGGALRLLAKEQDFLGEHTYVFLDKLNSDFVKIFHPVFPKRRNDGPQEEWLLPYELAEAGLLRVLVIDERVAEKCLEEISDGETRKVARRFTGTGIHRVSPPPLIWHLAFGAKLYIVTHLGFDSDPKPLHRQSYQQAEAKETGLLPCLKIRIESSGPSYDIRYDWSPDSRNGNKTELAVDAMIIHQGILDQLKKVKSADFLKEIRGSVPFVVVDSGRGIPPSLPATAKFLPFSILQDYIAGKRPAKYSLTQVVMALTKRKRTV